MGTDAKIFAIGDIHGCADSLRRLVERLPYDPGHDRLVFLGDYINRGPDSRAVLDFLCGLAENDPGAVFLMGNHEYLLVEYLRGRDPTLLPYLRRMGIEAMAASYGGTDRDAALADLSFLPDAHRAFLDCLRPYHRERGYLFVHAGIAPGVPLADNDIPSLCEVRDHFFTTPTGLDEKIVFGHTPFELPLVTPDKIGIDTGAAYGNMLTAIELPGEHFYHA